MKSRYVVVLERQPSIAPRWENAWPTWRDLRACVGARRLPPKPDKICRRDINSRIESPDETRTRRVGGTPVRPRELNFRLSGPIVGTSWWYQLTSTKKPHCGRRNFYLPPLPHAPFSAHSRWRRPLDVAVSSWKRIVAAGDRPVHKLASDLSWIMQAIFYGRC